MSILVAAIAVLIAIRVPLSFALLLGCLIFVLVNGRTDPIVLTQSMFAGLDSFVLIAVPLFLLSGNVMTHTSLTVRLTEFVSSWIGHLRGGLSNVAVMTNLVVSGISGSATVDAVTSSTLLVPGMRAAGYKPAFAAALNSAAATLGPMMPPSIIMLVYANLAYVSVARLFLAGFLPGLTIAAFLMVYARYHANHHGIMPLRRANWRQRGTATFRAIPALMMPAIIVGGILAGVFTPTEASAVAAAYAILVAVVGMRELSPAGVLRVLSETAVTTGVVMLMVAAANVVSWLLIVNGVGAAVIQLFAPWRGHPWMVLGVIDLVLLVLGVILEPIPLMMLIVPVLLPFVKSLGIDLIHFGIIVTFTTTIALTMPPFGLLMFISARIAGVSVEAFTREILPLLAVLLLALIVITYVPALSLWLPRTVL